MKAVIVPRHGGAEVLEYVTDFPDPIPRNDEVVVRVAATTVNRMDLLVRNGYPNSTLPLPHVPGADVAGTVEQVGAAVDSVRVGQRVVVYPILSCGECAQCRSGHRNICVNWRSIGMHRHGGYAEKVAVPAENVLPLPAELDFQRAATLPVAGLTAHHALASVGHLSKGEVCVLWGAAGGLGSSALQIARHLGARVVGIVGDAQKKSTVESWGCDLVIDRSSENVEQVLKSSYPEGADLVLDTVGAATYPTSLALLKSGGRMVSCGMIGGREVPLNIHMVYYRHLSIHGVFLGTLDDMRAVVDLAARGVLNPPVDRVLKLTESSIGHRALEADEQKGKVIIEVEG